MLFRDTLLITQKIYDKMEKSINKKLKGLNVFLTSRRGCACIFLQNANTSLSSRSFDLSIC